MEPVYLQISLKIFRLVVYNKDNSRLFGKAKMCMVKKVRIVLLMSVILILMGCGKQSSSQEGQESNFSSGEEYTDEDMPAWKRFAKEEITLDWYINYSWYATPWGDNIVSKKISEETGVNVNFITPIGNETEKLNALMVSNSLPDIITLSFWEPQIDEMIQNDMVYALNELADEYDPYFWEVTDDMVVNWYKKEDGNIYAYPNSAITPQDLEENDTIGSNQTFLVRKDIYEAIGSPDMTTIEGFTAAVQKAADMFPEVDGKPLIPVGAHVFDNEGNASFDKYLLNFLAVPWEKDGKFYDRYMDEEYIRWLKMFRNLGEKGLLANDIFVDTRTQMEEKLSEGRYFCMIYQYTDMLSQQKILYNKNPEMVYIAVEGPRNSKGEKPTLPCTSINGWTVTLISKNCKKPDRAIAFMDYLLSEHGQKRIFLGVEGETYDYIDGKPVLKEEVRNLLNTDRTMYDQLYGADDAYWMLQDIVMQQQWIQQSTAEMEQLKEWSRKYVVYNGQYDICLPMECDEAVAEQKIVKLWSQTLPKLLLAPTEEEFDRILSEFCEERGKLGFDRVQEMNTIYMKEAKKKLGITE